MFDATIVFEVRDLPWLSSTNIDKIVNTTPYYHKKEQMENILGPFSDCKTKFFGDGNMC